jgi:fructokinase
LKIKNLIANENAKGPAKTVGYRPERSFDRGARMKIAILGEALIDFKSNGNLAFQGFIGGSSLNVATATSRLGQSTGFLSQISTDLFGSSLKQHLKDNQIDLSFVLESSAPSTLAFVEERGGQAHFTFLGNGAADTLYDPQPRPVLPESLAFMQFGSISLLTEPTSSSITDIVAQYKDRLTVVLDPNCRPSLTPDLAAYKKKLESWIGLAHLVKVSDQDLGWLEPSKSLEEVARGWLALGPSAVIVTRGENGSVLYRLHQTNLEIQTPKVKVVDTVGAGDTFTAGLMVGLLEHGHERADQLVEHSDQTWLAVMRFAASSAAINCTRAGANPPTRAEVHEFLS